MENALVPFHTRPQICSSEPQTFVTNHLQSKETRRFSASFSQISSIDTMSIANPASISHQLLKIFIKRGKDWVSVGLRSEFLQSNGNGIKKVGKDYRKRKKKARSGGCPRWGLRSCFRCGRGSIDGPLWSGGRWSMELKIVLQKSLVFAIGVNKPSAPALGLTINTLLADPVSLSLHTSVGFDEHLLLVSELSPRYAIYKGLSPMPDRHKISVLEAYVSSPPTPRFSGPNPLHEAKQPSINMDRLKNISYYLVIEFLCIILTKFFHLFKASWNLQCLGFFGMLAIKCTHFFSKHRKPTKWDTDMVWQRVVVFTPYIPLVIFSLSYQGMLVGTPYKSDLASFAPKGSETNSSSKWLCHCKSCRRYTFSSFGKMLLWIGFDLPCVWSDLYLENPFLYYWSSKLVWPMICKSMSLKENKGVYLASPCKKKPQAFAYLICCHVSYHLVKLLYEGWPSFVSCYPYCSMPILALCRGYWFWLQHVLLSRTLSIVTWVSVIGPESSILPSMYLGRAALIPLVRYSCLSRFLMLFSQHTLQTACVQNWKTIIWFLVSQLIDSEFFLCTILHWRGLTWRGGSSPRRSRTLL